MQNAVDNDAMQLAFVGLVELLCIGSHRIKTDEQVSADAVSFRVVEGNDVGVIIVLQVLAVYLQYLFVGTEYVCYFSHFLSVAGCYLFHPFGGFAFLDGRHRYVFGLIGYHGFLTINLHSLDTKLIMQYS